MVDSKVTEKDIKQCLNVDGMLKLLKEIYPSLSLQHGENYSHLYKGAIWTGLDNGVMNNGKPIFITGESFGYESGVNKKFQLWLKRHGWYAECQDGETFFIIKTSDVH